MIYTRRLFLLLAFVVFASVKASAYPMFLEMYKADKFTNPNDKDVICNFCHMSPSGGDERNPFGQAFEKGGEILTPTLRAQFPDRFSYPVLKVDDSLTIHFSDPDNKIVIVETGGKKVAVDVSKQTVDGKAATPGGGVAAVSPSQPTGAVPAASFAESPIIKSEVPTDPFAREGAFLGQNVVDLPNGKAEKKGGVDFWIGHRFPESTFTGSSPSDLFGFDSSATVAFGVRAGLTDRLSVGASRSNYFRTIELNAAYQVSRQEDEMPLTLQVRGSVEGRNNFHRGDDPDWVGYSSGLQVVAVRTFADRVSIEAVPTFAFHTRNKNSFFTQFGSNHDNTIALGVGTGIRVSKTTSLVAEYVPRLWGFRGERINRPEIAFGIQKATYRHAFSLVFADMQPMTMARYAQGVGGGLRPSDDFGIGFNIYRKLR